MKLLSTLLALCSWLGVIAQSGALDSLHKQSFIYAVKDTQALGLDVYCTPSVQNRGCVLFVFGGAFIAGRRDDTLYQRYFRALVEHHYVVVSISYRLGLKGAGKVSKFHISPLRNAIDMAVEDVYDATNWILTHATQWQIDSASIILSGSSSGAITVLESDFDRRNQKPIASRLPASFEYAGVVAFSGAILSFDGKLRYQAPPAPTMMFHGTADQIVPYKSIRFFNRGFWGSSAIADVFRKKGYPFYLFREEGLGHEVSVFPMYDRLPEIIGFMHDYVQEKKPYQTDILFKDPTAKPLLTMTAAELIRKLQ